MKTKKEIRKENNEYFVGLQLQANCMKGAKVPKHYYLPAINRRITAGEYAKAIKAIRAAKPEQEFKQSFQAWWPKTGADIIKWEIVPAIHERINVRGLMPQPDRPKKSYEGSREHLASLGYSRALTFTNSDR